MPRFTVAYSFLPKSRPAAYIAAVDDYEEAERQYDISHYGKDINAGGWGRDETISSLWRVCFA